MSYILEALRKAERERNLGQVPDLAASHAPPAPPRRSPWLWLLALTLAVNAAALAVAFRLNRAEAPGHDAAQRPPASEQSLPQPPAQAANAEPPAEAVERDPPGPRLATVATPGQQKASGPMAGPPQAPAATIPEPASAPRAIDKPAPLLASLPAEFARSVPGIALDVHVYSQSLERRFVVMNARRYREGERMREGPLLETITQDGAVLSYRGQRFLIPVHR